MYGSSLDTDLNKQTVKKIFLNENWGHCLNNLILRNYSYFLRCKIVFFFLKKGLSFFRYILKYGWNGWDSLHNDTFWDGGVVGGIDETR